MSGIPGCNRLEPRIRSRRVTTRWPEHGGAKWVPITSTSVSPCSASSRRRVAEDCSRSVSGSANQSGSANCTGWWARSPVMSAWRPPDSTCTATWPGVCPGVDLQADLVGDPVVGRHEVGETGVDHGPHRVVDGRRVPGRAFSRPSAPTRRGTAGSARSGTWAPTRRRRAWCSTPRGRSAGACRSRCRPPPREAGVGEVGQERRLQVQRLHARDCRSLPMHVSTMILRSPAVMPNAWIDSTSLPSSSTKCGRSHDACDAITSSRRARQQPAGGDVGDALHHARDGDVADLSSAGCRPLGLPRVSALNGWCDPPRAW